MKTAWIKARQTKYGTYLTIYILVVIAIVIGVNWLANENNHTFDTTSNKLYTLTDATKQTLEGLKSDVTIKYYGRPGDEVRMLLDRYKDASGKVKIQYIDPEKNPELATQGIHSGSIFIQNGDKREEAKSVTEMELTSAIKRTMTKGTRTACVITGSGEGNISDTQNEGGFGGIKTVFENNGVKIKELPVGQKIDDDCTVLVVAGPTVDYPAPAVAAVKKFVDDGGKALLLFAPSVSDLPGGNKGEPGLEKMVADWGVTVNNDLLYDDPPRTELGPKYLLTGNYGTHTIGKKLKNYATLFPLCRSLTMANGKGFEPVVETMGNTYEYGSLQQPLKENPDKDKKGPFTLAAAGNAGKGRIVVVGSAAWLSNLMFETQVGPVNAQLGLNMMNWLTADESLMSIPTREREDRRIMLTTWQIIWVWISSLVMIPLFVIVAGFVVWWKRR